MRKSKNTFLKMCGKVISYLSKKLLDGILIGIVAGIIVTYLFHIPVISLIDTTVRIVDDKNIKLYFEYENKGKSPAINISSTYLYGITDNPNDFIRLKARNAERMEAGNIFSYSPDELLPLHEEEKKAIILIQVTYEDSDKLRQFFNEKILKNQYEIQKWAYHRDDKKVLSALPLPVDVNFRKRLVEKLSE